MRRALVLLLLAVPLVVPAPAAAVSCGSGFAIHEQAGVKILVADFRSRYGRETGLFGCSDRVRRPALIWQSSPATTLAGGVTGRFGRRLALDIEEYADGGNGHWLGWFDLRTGRTRLTAVRGPRKPVDPEEDNENWTPPSDALAVAPDGSLAYAFAAFGKTYELFAQAFDGKRFGRQTAVVTVPEAEFDPASLTTTTTELRWRTRGAEASVPLAGLPSFADARRPRRVRGLSCRHGEGLYLGNRARVFRNRRGVFACAENERSRPVQLGGRRARLLHAIGAGESLAYVVREGTRETIGVFDSRASTLRARPRRAGDYGGRPRILDLHARTRTGVAFVAEVGARRVVSFLPFAGRGLGAPREIANLAADGIEPRTLRVVKGAVAWRAVGEPRSAPRG